MVVDVVLLWLLCQLLYSSADVDEVIQRSFFKLNVLTDGLGKTEKNLKQNTFVGLKIGLLQVICVSKYPRKVIM